jgi:hypothetical protein
MCGRDMGLPPRGTRAFEKAMKNKRNQKSFNQYHDPNEVRLHRQYNLRQPSILIEVLNIKNRVCLYSAQQAKHMSAILGYS